MINGGPLLAVLAVVLLGPRLLEVGQIMRFARADGARSILFGGTGCQGVGVVDDNDLEAVEGGSTIREERRGKRKRRLSKAV